MAPKRKRGGKAPTGRRASKRLKDKDAAAPKEAVNMVSKLSRGKGKEQAEVANDTGLVQDQVSSAAKPSAHSVQHLTLQQPPQQLRNPASTADAEQERMRLIQEEAFARFEQMLNDVVNETDGDEGPDLVRNDELMTEDEVTTAIMVVTEAIKYRLTANQAPFRLFDITTADRISQAKVEQSNGGSVDVRSLRSRQPLLFPWIYNEEEQKVVSKRLGHHLPQGSGKEDNSRSESSDGNSSTAKKNGEKSAQAVIAGDKDHRSHVFLVLVRRTPDNLCEVRVYDSYVLNFRTNPVEWWRVLRTIQNVVRNMEWFGGGTAHPELDDGGYDIRFAPEVEVHVSRQDGAWTCGVHTVLNAWCIAMNLLPNPDFVAGREDDTHFYDTAVRIINLAVRGFADSSLIYAFLVGHGFALPNKVRSQCPSSGPLVHEHSIRSAASLRAYVDELHQAQHDNQAIAQLENQGPSSQGLPGVASAPLMESASNKDPRTMLARKVARFATPYAQSAGISGDKVQRPIRVSSKAKLTFSVLSHRLFSTPDCIGFWRQLEDNRAIETFNNSPELGRLPPGSQFLHWIVEALDNDATARMSHEEKQAWFVRQQERLRQALSYPVDKIGKTDYTLGLVKAQLSVSRKLLNNEMIDMASRKQLLDLHDAQIACVRSRPRSAE